MRLPPLQLAAVVACCLAVAAQRRPPLRRLPRLTFEPTFAQYSGYLDAVDGMRLFYWLVEASHVDPAGAPLLLWLNGGPGCSSIGGLLMTNGPFLADRWSRLVPNPFAWNREANVLYIDSPVGTGMSEPGQFDDSVLNDEFTTTSNVHALLHFFHLFPEYSGRPFYLAGESYAGIYIPLLAVALQDRPEFPSVVNLKAAAIGNGLLVPIDDPLLRVSREEFGEVMGLDFRQNVSDHNVSINSYNCANPCHMHPSTNIYPCINSTALVAYLNDKEVRRVLGVLPSVPDYVICQHERIFVHYDSARDNVLPQLERMVLNNVSVLLYHGHLDHLIPARTTRLLLKGLSEAVPPDNVEKDTWLYCRRAFGSVGLQVGGLQRSFADGRLIFRTVIGAGHTVATDLPEAGYQILVDLLRPGLRLPDCDRLPPEQISAAAGGARRTPLQPLLPPLLLLLLLLLLLQRAA